MSEQPESYQQRQDKALADNARRIVMLGQHGAALNDAIRNGHPQKASDSMAAVFELVDKLRGY